LTVQRSKPQAALLVAWPVGTLVAVRTATTVATAARTTPRRTIKVYRLPTLPSRPTPYCSRIVRAVRRIAVLAATAAALAACGSSGASTSATPIRISFGISGGNITPFRITIEPTGRVRWHGTTQPPRRRLSHAKLVSLSRLVRADFAAGLTSRQCPGVNPDFASDFIRATGRTVTVHGRCEPRFNRLWTTLTQAFGLHYG
jgi:hypothetical protein